MQPLVILLPFLFIGPAIPQLFCPNGQAIGPCASGHCPIGTFCDAAGSCCDDGFLICLNSCVGGICPTNYTCVPSENNQCCQIQTCGISVGPCKGGACPSGYSCIRNECCTSCVDSTPKCQEWNSRGFCNSTFYSPQDKQLCAATCGLC